MYMVHVSSSCIDNGQIHVHVYYVQGIVSRLLAYITIILYMYIYEKCILCINCIRRLHVHQTRSVYMLPKGAFFVRAVNFASRKFAILLRKMLFLDKINFQ